MLKTHKHRRAFTLAEVVLSTAVMSVLMGGLATAVMLAGRALPNGKSAAGATIKGYNSLEQLDVELAVAQAIISKTTTSVEFTVADRDGDLAPETIRYGWSGVIGSPLTRQYNLLAPVEVTADVGNFAMTYDVTAYSRPVPPADVQTGEILLASNESLVGLLMVSITSTNWTGQFFRPVLPADAVAWSVTRVMFPARAMGPINGETLVQVRTAAAGNVPDNRVIEQRSMWEKDLSAAFLWQQFNFGSVSGIAPNNGLCLVLQHVSSKNSCTIEYTAMGAAFPNEQLVSTANAGVSWTGQPAQGMIYKVYGVITSRTPATTVNGFILNGVRASIRVGDDPAAQVATRVRLLNTPEVTGI